MVLMVGIPAGAETPVVVPGVDTGVNPNCPAGSGGGGGWGGGGGEKGEGGRGESGRAEREGVEGGQREKGG